MVIDMKAQHEKREARMQAKRDAIKANRTQATGEGEEGDADTNTAPNQEASAPQNFGGDQKLPDAPVVEKPKAATPRKSQSS
jgi:hypothetical protein